MIFLDLSALKFDFLRSYFYIYPMIAANYLIVILFIPFHLFFRTARYSLLVSFVKCLFPFGESGVRFRDYIVGAILTAMSRPIQAFVQSFYYFTCKPCLSNNENEFGFSRINNFTLFFNPLGYFIRMIQSINRLYYTKLIWPHFVNFVKFVYAVFSQVYLWLYYGGYYQSLYQTFVVHLISNLSLLFWDFYVDWGVFRTLDNRYFLLRKNIMFPPWVYYISMVINTILRLYFYFELFDILDRRDEFYQFIAISLEIFRRMLWLLIRLENEHQNNPEKYREVLSIPQLVEA